MKGTQGIPVLQLEVLNKLISKLDKVPSNFFTNLFASVQYPSDTIKWEMEYNSGGMTPFVAPGSIAPTVGLDGVGQGEARAAYWKEKMYFDEEFLNNLREPGTTATYATAERKLAKGAKKLQYRCQRRREWMCSNMITQGSINYSISGGAKFSVSYGIPATHIVTLDNATRGWNAGTSRNPVEDIFDAKTILRTDSGVQPEYCMMNSELLKILILDSKIQALLEKSAFGNGDLFSNPGPVLASLLGVGKLTVYDEVYEVQGYITGISTVTITLDDVTDFEVGGTARFVNTKLFNVWEDQIITAVDVVASTITVDFATSLTFVAGRDKVVMMKKFIQDNEFIMFASKAGGEPIAEFMEAPYGVQRRWGFYADTEAEWDPEGVWLRVQDKGLPVLYHPDAIFKYITHTL
jgi:hypothetical protein